MKKTIITLIAGLIAFSSFNSARSQVLPSESQMPSDRALEFEMRNTQCVYKGGYGYDSKGNWGRLGNTGWSSMGPCKFIGKNPNGTDKWILIEKQDQP